MEKNQEATLAPTIGITARICLNPFQSKQVEIRCVAEFAAEINMAQLLSLSAGGCVCVLEIQIFPHRKHVIALHVPGVLVLTFVVKLPEEVEGQNSVEVDDNSQQPHSQDQLKGYSKYIQIFSGFLK